ncbi:MAG: hypothetical protein ACYC3L_01915 [Gemmatimonadaceae bacterium]
MILRSLRRLRHLLLPLYAGAMLAFVVRLGWAHDPTCPHHRAHAAHASHSAHMAPMSPMSPMATMAQLEHASTGPETAALAGAPQESPDSQCRCLDRDCTTGGTVAALHPDSGLALAIGGWTFDGATGPMPVSVARPGAYRTHRLPYPHAPPGPDRLT